MKKTLSCLLLCFCWALVSCSDKDGNDAPDISGIAIPYQSYPFYKDFSSIDTQNIRGGLSALKQKYPEFLDFYLDTLLNFGYKGAYEQPNKLLYDFLTMKDYRELQDTVNKAYADTRMLDEKLKKTFGYIRYYDSSFTLPQQVYYFVSGLTGLTCVLQNEQNMGIGLDMFLGADFIPYSQIRIPEYGKIRMTSENIPIWAAKAIYEDKYPFRQEDQTLLELMIQRGKELYFLEKVTPYVAENVRLGFTPEQLRWSNENEALIYNFFIQYQLLYETNLQKTARYVNDGPSSSGMPSESPGNTGSFIGWKIVKRYAVASKLSLPAVLAEKDAQKILQTAAYKP